MLYMKQLESIDQTQFLFDIESGNVKSQQEA